MLILPTVPALLGLLVYGAGASPVVVERNLVPACSAAFRALGVGATSICVRLVGPIQTKASGVALAARTVETPNTFFVAIDYDQIDRDHYSNYSFDDVSVCIRASSAIAHISTLLVCRASTTLLPAIVYALSLKKVSRSMKLKERCSTQSATLIAPTTTVQVNSATATSVQSTTVTTVRAYTVTTVTSSTSVSTDVESVHCPRYLVCTVSDPDPLRRQQQSQP